MTTFFEDAENGSVGELSTVCSQIVLECLYLARIGRPEFLWSVNKLARAVTKWTKACDKRLARLISYIHHTNEYRKIVMWETQHNNADLACFKTLILQVNMKTQNQQQVLCIFGSQTFVPTSWLCKKQTSVSHSSTKAELISLDAGLRVDGIPALDLWDQVIEVSHSSPTQSKKTKDQA